MRPFILFENVSKTYDGEQYVVKNIDIGVQKGEFLVLLGGSGCGKTTTLKMINRLVDPSSGRVTVNGKDISQIDAYSLRRQIGYAFQAVGLFPHMTVAENIAVVPKLLKWSFSAIEERIDELLVMVELDPAIYRDRFPSELSGGQRQRVGFARALASGPSVLLLDEPFGALDPLTRDALQSELKVIHQKLNITIVMVTHDMVEALLLADRIAVLHEGEVAQLGTPSELLNNPQHEYVANLMATPKQQHRIVESMMKDFTKKKVNAADPALPINKDLRHV